VEHHGSRSNPIRNGNEPVPSLPGSRPQRDRGHAFQVASADQPAVDLSLEVEIAVGRARYASSNSGARETLRTVSQSPASAEPGPTETRPCLQRKESKPLPHSQLRSDRSRPASGRLTTAVLPRLRRPTVSRQLEPPATHPNRPPTLRIGLIFSEPCKIM
jgi:hypothetical protein